MIKIRKRDPIERVERHLKGIKIPRTLRAAINKEPVQTVTLGQVNRPFHKFKGHSKFTSDHPELWSALQEMAAYIDPDHRWTSVTLNHNVVCKPHKDARNDGLTMIIGLGDYTGGELCIEGQDIDINHKPHYFNGFLHEHYNRAFTGDRWTLMFYSLRKSWEIVHRPEDVPIIREVYHGNQYHCKEIGFGIEKGELWIDIGAHIGCWSKKCQYYGAQTISYEPDSENYALLIQNSTGVCHNKAVGSKDATVSLTKGSRGYFSRIEGKGPGQGTEDITQVRFESVIVPGCCVKMDIEGSEMEILDTCDFTGVSKMVLAYHINKDHERSNFLRRMERLKTWFGTVHHQVIKEEHMNFFPNEIIVYCRV